MFSHLREKGREWKELLRMIIFHNGKYTPINQKIVLHQDPSLKKVHLFIHLFYIHPFIHPLIHPSIHPFIHPSIHPSNYSLTHPSIRLFIHSSTHPSIHLSIHPSIHSSSIIRSCYSIPNVTRKGTSTKSSITY